MLFTEGRFFVFFAVVFGGYWAMRSHPARKAWLLAASWLFYGAWDWRFLGLLWITTLVDYGAGLLLDGASRHTPEGTAFSEAAMVDVRKAVRERDTRFGDYGEGPRSV